MKKQWTTGLLILLLAVIAGLAGYNYFQRPFLKEFLSKQAKQAELQLEQEKQQQESEVSPIDKAIRDMSLEEKVYQLIAFPVTVGDPKANSLFGSNKNISWIKKNNPGYVTIFGNGLSKNEVTEFITKAKANENNNLVSPLIVVDHEGGAVQRLSGEGYARLPAWSQVCDLAVEERNEQLASSAAELSESGVNIVLAPVLDVNTGKSFLKSRACDNEIKVLATARSYIELFSKENIMPVVKHFPGLGNVASDIHFTGASVESTKQDLRPFESLLNVYPNIGVMTTHVQIEGVTGDTPCSLSEVCLQGFPKKFPEVMLFTDALEMDSAVESKIFDQEQDEPARSISRLALVAHRALLAGNHVLIFGQEVKEKEIQEIVDYLVKMSESDVRFYGLIEQALRKTLELKL